MTRLAARADPPSHPRMVPMIAIAAKRGSRVIVRADIARRCAELLGQASAAAICGRIEDKKRAEARKCPTAAASKARIHGRCGSRNGETQ